jgi:hypothetical protein
MRRSTVLILPLQLVVPDKANRIGHCPSVLEEVAVPTGLEVLMVVDLHFTDVM